MMKCKICHNREKEKEFLATAKKWSSWNLTNKPDKCLREDMTAWRPQEHLDGEPGRKHKYRCPGCKAEYCLQVDCEYHGEWVNEQVISVE
jgi:hypothetical protein